MYFAKSDIDGCTRNLVIPKLPFDAQMLVYDFH